jgi:hypothetical protein
MLADERGVIPAFPGRRWRRIIVSQRGGEPWPRELRQPGHRVVFRGHTEPRSVGAIQSISSAVRLLIAATLSDAVAHRRIHVRCGCLRVSVNAGEGIGVGHLKTS